jgi:hypothetical protein
MNILFANEPLDLRPPSLFLAGPTPRRAGTPSWRPEALSILARLGFAGTVLVPECRDWTARFDYLDQVEWEFAGLEAATVLAFWVPRDLEALPASPRTSSSAGTPARAGASTAAPTARRKRATWTGCTRS